MTFEAGCGLVCTLQREGGLLVLLEAEHTDLEPVGEEMAFHAIRVHPVLGEFAFVEILMATAARVEHDGFGVGSLVALLALHIGVFAL